MKTINDWIMITLACLAFLLLTEPVRSETITINYYGAYETIEVERHNDYVEITVQANQFKSEAKLRSLANIICNSSNDIIAIWSYDHQILYVGNCIKVNDTFHRELPTFDRDTHIDQINRSRACKEQGLTC